MLALLRCGLNVQKSFRSRFLKCLFCKNATGFLKKWFITKINELQESIIIIINFIQTGLWGLLFVAHLPFTCRIMTKNKHKILNLTTLNCSIVPKTILMNIFFLTYINPTRTGLSCGYGVKFLEKVEKTKRSKKLFVFTPSKSVLLLLLKTILVRNQISIFFENIVHLAFALWKR